MSDENIQKNIIDVDLEYELRGRFNNIEVVR